MRSKHVAKIYVKRLQVAQISVLLWKIDVAENDGKTEYSYR